MLCYIYNPVNSAFISVSVFDDNSINSLKYTHNNVYDERLVYCTVKPV